MSGQAHPNQRRAGAFILAGLVALGIVVFMIGEKSALFVRTVTLHVYFEDISGLVVGAPVDYRTLLEPLPAAVQFVSQPDASVDIAHVFTSKRSELSAALGNYRKQLSPGAAVWVSWPKKSSRLPSEITEDTVREIALPLGFVDVKVCAVNEVWSGLKLVVRKELR